MHMEKVLVNMKKIMKLLNIIKEVQINGEISHIHEWGDHILLRYYLHLIYEIYNFYQNFNRHF